jgi:hypothetical protein
MKGVRARWVHEAYYRHFSGEAFCRGLNRCLLTKLMEGQ